MGDSKSGQIPPGLLAGRLEGFNVPDLLWSLHDRRMTGVLHLGGERPTRSLYLEHGQIIFASSQDPDDRLGPLMLRRNVVTLEQLEDAVSRLEPGKRLGTILVEAGGLTPEKLVDGVLFQVKSIVLEIFSWAEGEYSFVEGPLPTEEVIKLGIRTNELLLEGISRVRSLGRMRRSVGGTSTVFGLASGWQTGLDGLSLNEGQDALIRRLEEGPESVENLCREVFLSNFEIYQTLWTFKVLGVIEEREAQWDTASAAAYKGHFDVDGFPELLVRLCTAGETGVLYVNRSSHERTFHLRQGQCLFATSNDVDDGLLAYLLRRGVISLRDREETTKRLLSNKRVGTILLELGVIDDSDLREMVRQQLTEIICDTFRWHGAEYYFIPGALPSIEDITLDVNLQALVTQGLRRVLSWSRVAKGCGGLNAVLALTPDYLDVLDAMEAGGEEWEVTAALKTPRSAKEVCRLSHLGDFRVCRILWTLKVLGALEVLQADAVREPLTVPAPVAAAVESTVQRVEVEELDEPLAESEAEPVEAATEPAPVEQAPREPWPEAEPEPVEVVAEPEPFESVAASEPGEPAERPSSKQEETRVHFPDERSPAEEPGVPTTGQAMPADLESEVDASLSLADRKVGGVEQPAYHERSAQETQLLSREEVEAALRGEPSASQPELPAFDSQPAEFPEPEPEAAFADETPDRGNDLPISELEQSTQTQRLSREEVEAALGAQSEAPADAPSPLETAEPAFEAAEVPPPDAAREDAESLPLPRDEDYAEPVVEELWDPPAEVDRMIARFNAMQRIIYRTVRSEVGAGAANFVRSCCGDDVDEAVTGAELQSDGTWDATALRRTIVEHRISDPWPDYQRVIEKEIELLRAHIGEARAHELQEQVNQVEASGAAG